MEFAKSRCKRFETKVIDSGLGPGTYDLKDISRPEGKLGAYCTRSQRFNEVPVLPANLGPGSYSFSPAKEGAALFVGNRKAVGKNRGKKVLEVMNSNKKRKSEPQECQQQMILSPCKDPTKESSLASKVASWETELVTREKQLEEVVGCCGMLSASLMQCKDQQKTYQQECTDLRQSIASLTKEQRTLSLLLDNQKEQTSESRATLRQALQRLEANELCITRMVKMGADLDDILLNNAEELASLLIRNETAKSTEKELRLKVKKLSSMMKTTQSAIESAEKTIQQFAEDVAELEQKLQNQEAAFGEERNQLQQDVINMQSDSERQDKVLDSTLLKVIRLENAQNDFQHKHQLAIARKDAQLRAAAETHSKQMADMKNCHLKIIENMVQEKNIEITALQQAHLKEILNNAALAAETMRIRENELQNVIQNMSLESSVQFDSFDKKVRELVADQAETNEANTNLRENAIKLNSQLKSLQIEQANQEIFVKDMQKDVILKNDKLQELSESLAIKNSRLQQLEQELAAKCHEVVQLKATTEISEEKYRQITEHSSALTQQLTKTLHASESRYSGLFSEHTILRQTLQELTHNLNCLQTQHAAKNLSLEQCESRERAFRKDIMLMEQSRIQLETELQGKYAFVEHKLRELMDEIAQKESVTTTLKTEKITLLEKIAALQKSVSDYQVNLTDLTEKNSSMKESLEMQNKLLNTAQNEYETTFGTVLDLTEQNKILEVKWSASVASCACLEELLQEHKLHSVTVENELAATQLQLQSTIFTLKLIEEKERDIQIQRSTNLEILETRTFERDSLLAELTEQQKELSKQAETVKLLQTLYEERSADYTSLTLETAKLGGHVNHRQKINLHHRIKEENNRLKQENIALRYQLSQVQPGSAPPTEAKKAATIEDANWSESELLALAALSTPLLQSPAQSVSVSKAISTFPSTSNARQASASTRRVIKLPASKLARSILTDQENTTGPLSAVSSGASVKKTVSTAKRFLAKKTGALTARPALGSINVNATQCI